jgi:16S rRNA (guanine1516-N2)-methyltransferase
MTDQTTSQAVLCSGIELLVLPGADLSLAAQTQQALAQLPCKTEQPAAFRLAFEPSGVSLISLMEPACKPLQVDFTAGGAAHRRKFGGGAGQMIAKAVGLQGALKPRVLDATAGLGGDSFVLACLGAQVTLCERSPVAYALLADGLARARLFAEREDPELLEILQRMHLVAGDTIEHIERTGRVYPVIYLDPMFPERQKSAQVKKSMQFFHAVIGTDPDADQLFNAALPKAWCRLVVKRPRLAPSLGQKPPSLVLEGKSCRFDIYTHRKLSPETLAACGGFQG